MPLWFMGKQRLGNLEINMGYLDRIDSYREEMVKALQGLISIPSVVAPRVGDMPFGEDVHKAFEYMLSLAEKEGLDTVNIDNYGGHIELAGYLLNEKGEPIERSDETMGILTHLDVVPEGSNWDYPPYEGRVVDDRLYGRGAIDDKGPTIAAFYAMKALKDEGFIPRKNIRLILGLDEEAGTGWEGMNAYFSKVQAPDFAFTPDAEFPAIHAEMGILIFELVKKINKSVNKGVELRSLVGGNAANMVADYARAVIRADSYDDIKETLKEFKEETGYNINSKGIGKSLEIVAHGLSSHGARPWLGLNAISIMMEFLSRLEFANEDLLDFIEFYINHIGFEYNGKSIGCGFSDEISGDLIFNVGKIDLDTEAARLTVNIRYPVTLNQDDVYEGMMPNLDKYNFGVVKLNHQEAIYVPEDDPLIVTLMDVYRKHTGDTESRPLVIGGGTYARSMENAVAFGMAFPDEPELAHQKNESISIDNMVKATKIFAECIYELTK
jgi:succinyl-diaminopimelate desuccinylase